MLAAFFLTSPVNFVKLTITITSHTALNVSDLKIRNKNKNNIKKLYLSIKCIDTVVLTGDTVNRKRTECCLGAGLLIAAGVYPGFCSMKRLGLYRLPLDGMVVHRMVVHGVPG